MKPLSLSITIPAYNEEGSIEKVAIRALLTAKSLSKNYEVLLVDDGSTDNTGSIIDTLAKKHKEIRVIHHKKNQGFSGAIKTCYRNASKDLVFLAPADGQVDITDCKLFIEKMYKNKKSRITIHNDQHGKQSFIKNPTLLGFSHWDLRFDSEIDVVVGYRLHNPEPLSRKINSFLFHLLYRILFGVKLREISTCILWRKKVLDSIEITSSARSAMIEPEVVYRAWQHGYRFAQIGIPYYPRTHGKPNGGNPLMIFETLKEMFRLWYTLTIF